MKVFVKAKVFAKEERVEKIDESHFVVQVREAPVRGAANRAITKALARYFNASVERVVMVSGFSSREKIFEIK